MTEQSAPDSVVGEVKEVNEPPVLLRSPQSMAVDPKTQLIVARDNAEVVRLIKVWTRGASIPKTLDTEDKLILAWQTAASLNVPPAIAIQNMAIINGTLSIWGQLPMGLARATKEVTDFELITINDKQEEINLKYKNLDTEVWGAVVNLRRGGGSRNQYYFTMKDAARAGLDKKRGPWQEYRQTMICRRTIGWSVKVDFPDALMGLSVAEYDLNELPDLKDVSPSKESPPLDRVRDLNNRFSDSGPVSVSPG